MSRLTLAQANQIIAVALEKSNQAGCQPMGIAVLDEAGNLKAFAREDGASMFRFEVARAKAWGAVGMGVSSRVLGERAKNNPNFFVADSRRPDYKLVKNTVYSQNYVAEYRLEDYTFTEADVLHHGDDAWNAALNTINVGKYNLGWASIGICTHSYYEAIDHAANRHLYGKTVTDFPHVRQPAEIRRARLAGHTARAAENRYAPRHQERTEGTRCQRRHDPAG